MTTTSATTLPVGNTSGGQVESDLQCFSPFSYFTKQGGNMCPHAPTSPCHCQATDNISSQAEDTSICGNIQPSSCALTHGSCSPQARGIRNCFFFPAWMVRLLQVFFSGWIQWRSRGFLGAPPCQCGFIWKHLIITDASVVYILQHYTQVINSCHDGYKERYCVNSGQML